MGRRGRVGGCRRDPSSSYDRRRRQPCSAVPPRTTDDDTHKASYLVLPSPRWKAPACRQGKTKGMMRKRENATTTSPFPRAAPGRHDEPQGHDATVCDEQSSQSDIKPQDNSFDPLPEDRDERTGGGGRRHRGNASALPSCWIGWARPHGRSDPIRSGAL